MTESESPHTGHLGIIEVSGPEAADFLRAQLTNDVLRLGPDRHFLAGWCDAKGRTLMIARVVESHTGYWLLLPRSLVDAVLRRLRMFVLRARVELADVTARYRLSGRIAPSEPPANRTERDGDTLRLGLPVFDEATPRALVVSPGDAQAPAATCTVDNDEWQLAEVDAGLPTIYPQTQSLFVPQMLNLQWLMGIDFDKGCYPGQEVIARLHYRGRLTRRMYRLAWSGRCPPPGKDVIDERGTRRGTIVRAARAGDTDGRLLAVLRTDTGDSVLEAEGTTLKALELPYATPA